MRLCLIGMSSVGKSFCAKNLAATKGYRHIDCDAMIEERLAAELGPQGLSGIEGVATWMGHPTDPQYTENSQRYLSLEREVMEEVLATLPDDPNASFVIDTTGSVIYLGDAILDALRKKTRIVYLEASEKHVDQLFRSYSCVRPKPVIWGDSYQPHPNETPDKTLARCYPDLLRERAVRYNALAHVVIPTHDLAKHWSNIGSFILERSTST